MTRKIETPQVYTKEELTQHAAFVFQPSMREALIKVEHRFLTQHLRRATRLGLPATLTLEEWLSNLYHFHYGCAYCQQHFYAVLEHFIPLSFGGGTTVDNCVPACGSCNVLKGGIHPLMITDPRMVPGIQRVYSFLNTRRGVIA